MMYKHKPLKAMLVFAILFAILLPVGAVSAATSAKVVSITGDVLVMRGGGDKAFKAFVNMRLTEGDRVITGKGAKAEIELDDESAVITLTENTRIYMSELRGTNDSQQTSISLQSGGISNSVKKALTNNSRYEIKTPTAVMGVRGTHFLVSINPATGDTALHVATGSVEGYIIPPQTPMVMPQIPIITPHPGELGFTQPGPSPIAPIPMPIPFVLNALEQIRFNENDSPEQLQQIQPEPLTLVGLDLTFIEQIEQLAQEQPGVIPPSVFENIEEARAAAIERSNQMEQNPNLAPDEFAENPENRQRIVTPILPETITPPPPPAPLPPQPVPGGYDDDGDDGYTPPPPPTPTATINILSVTPDADLVPGTDVSFDVEISYSFTNMSQAQIYVGFNDQEPNKYNLKANEIVTDNSGTLTFTDITATVRDWEATSFAAYVNVSEYPHPQDWEPIASDRKPLNIATPIATPFITHAQLYSSPDDNSFFDGTPLLRNIGTQYGDLLFELSEDFSATSLSSIQFSFNHLELSDNYPPDVFRVGSNGNEDYLDDITFNTIPRSINDSEQALMEMLIPEGITLPAGKYIINDINVAQTDDEPQGTIQVSINNQSPTSFPYYMTSFCDLTLGGDLYYVEDPIAANQTTPLFGVILFEPIRAIDAREGEQTIVISIPNIELADDPEKWNFGKFNYGYPEIVNGVELSIEPGDIASEKNATIRITVEENTVLQPDLYAIYGDEVILATGEPGEYTLTIRLEDEGEFPGIFVLGTYQNQMAVELAVDFVQIELDSTLDDVYIGDIDAEQSEKETAIQQHLYSYSYLYGLDIEIDVSYLLDSNNQYRITFKKGDAEASVVVSVNFIYPPMP